MIVIIDIQRAMLRPWIPKTAFVAKPNKTMNFTQTPNILFLIACLASPRPNKAECMGAWTYRNKKNGAMKRRKDFALLLWYICVKMVEEKHKMMMVAKAPEIKESRIA